MRLSDDIERFIKELITQESPQVELKRNELAEYFGCAPSQINYVLATRFTINDGYVTESRRGGGGYIRIVRVTQGGRGLLEVIERERIGDSVSAADAARLIRLVTEQGLIDERQAGVMAAAVSPQAMALPVP